jgi:hypothetical protein
VTRAVAATACLVCGRPEPLGMTVCPACGGAREGVADQLIFVVPSRVRSSRERIRERLAAITGQPSRSEAVESASLGLRALARVPAASAPEIVARLEDEGIMVTATRADRAWAAVPISFTFLLAAGAAAGILAGLQGQYALLVLTPLFVTLVGWSAMRGVARPVYPDAADREVPPALVRALAELPPGHARDIAAELSQAAREVLAPDSRKELSPGLVRTIEELLPVAADAALDLAALDQSISDFESRSRGDDAVPDAFSRGLKEMLEVRTRVSLYLLEVTGLVGRLQGMSADGLSSASTRLRELTSDLKASSDLAI